jgi:hypothetical protein
VETTADGLATGDGRRETVVVGSVVCSVDAAHESSAWRWVWWKAAGKER